MHLQVGYQSSIGLVRAKNEDHVAAFYDRGHHLLAIVADGIGGNLGGEVASKMAVDGLGEQFQTQNLKSPAQAERWIREQLAQQNQRIIETASHDPHLKGMGTTFVGVVLFDQRFIISNIGDSRGYQFSNRHLKQLTVDHSYVNELVKAGKITKEEAKTYPYQHVIVRSLGVVDQANPTISSGAIEAGDQILLCSDGLTDLVSHAVIEMVLASKRTVAEKCQTLVDTANQNGGTDNVTVLVIEAAADGGVVGHD